MAKRNKIQSQLDDISGKVSILQEAKEAGLNLTGSTTVQEAEAFLAGQKKTTSNTTKTGTKSGISLNDDGVTTRDSGALGGLSDFGISSSDLKNIFSTSIAGVNEEDIRREATREFAPARSAIEGRFGKRITEAREEAAQQGRALEGQLGTRRRFSSSAQAFLQYTDEQNSKEIANLEMQMEDALANFDMQAAQFIDKRIAQRNQEARQRFNDVIKMLDFAEQMNEAEETANLAERDGAIADLISQGIDDPIEIQRKMLEAGYTSTRLEDVTGIQELLQEKGADLTGVSADLKTFAFLNPDLEPGTAEYKQAYNNFVATQAALKRKPESADEEDEYEFSFSSADEETLLGAGMTGQMLGEVEQMISEGYTISDIISANPEQFGDAQVKAMNKVFGVEDQTPAPQTQADVENLIRDFLSPSVQLYTKREAKNQGEESLKASLGVDKLPKSYKNALETVIDELYE